ncbi:MAG: prephenate dehydratase [Nitrospirota bacterium]
MDRTLQGLRQRIDEIDDTILGLLNRRAEIVTEVGRVKRQEQAHAHAPTREREILERLERENPGPFPNDGVRAVFREIMSASLALEQPLKVAYLGPEGTFTHMACLKQFGASAGAVPVNSIKDVFSEVERGRADYGVVPIENSTEGVVTHTLDLLADSQLKIAGEVVQEISHYLLSRSGVLADVKRIYSHPQPVAQCRGWLSQHVPNIPIVEVYSTARAAEMCRDDPDAAAIASDLAARLYGLTVIQKRIEDNPTNTTRFLVIAPRAPERTGRDKTSVMVSVKDRVGALYDMLKPFSEYGLNLTKIESRPSRRKAWEYFFYIDVEGHIEDEPVKQALEALRSQCQVLKVLGSYPRTA